MNSALAGFPSCRRCRRSADVTPLDLPTQLPAPLLAPSPVDLTADFLLFHVGRFAPGPLCIRCTMSPQKKCTSYESIQRWPLGCKSRSRSRPPYMFMAAQRSLHPASLPARRPCLPFYLQAPAVRLRFVCYPSVCGLQ